MATVLVFELGVVVHAGRVGKCGACRVDLAELFLGADPAAVHAITDSIGTDSDHCAEPARDDCGTSGRFLVRERGGWRPRDGVATTSTGSVGSRIECDVPVGKDRRMRSIQRVPTAVR